MDFHQHGPTTLHDLQPERRGHARALVMKHARDRPAALVLPMLYSEIERPAMLGIRQGLERADFLEEVVVSLTAERADEVERVRRLFAGLPTRVTVLWCEGPEVREALEGLADRGFDIRGTRGKGLAVWLGLGVASEASEAIALHDADIERYDPKVLHRLLLPLVVPEMDFFFAKGYYARLTEERMFGRVTRLFLWPFLDALTVTLQRHSPLLAYLRAFRYPLSGEMAIRGDLARGVRVPTDWGLELGLLGEVYRSAAPKRICQVDLGTYNHKHKPVGEGPTEGLQRMALDIAGVVFRLLASNEGMQVTPSLLTTLRVAYRREAQEAIRKYHMDSIANGLRYDRHAEELIVEQLEPLVRQAGILFTRAHAPEPIGEWLRAMSADAEAPRRIRGASTLPVKARDVLIEAARAELP